MRDVEECLALLAVVLEGKIVFNRVKHSFDEFEVIRNEDVIRCYQDASILVEQGQLQHVVDGLIDEGILPDFRDLLGGLVTDPVVGAPGVDVSDFIAGFLDEIFVIVDEHVSFHKFSIPLIISVYPEYARKSGLLVDVLRSLGLVFTFFFLTF